MRLVTAQLAIPQIAAGPGPGSWVGRASVLPRGTEAANEASEVPSTGIRNSELVRNWDRVIGLDIGHPRLIDGLFKLIVT